MRFKTVYADGSHRLANDENNRDMAGFVELWEMIHRHAPYPKTEVKQVTVRQCHPYENLNVAVTGRTWLYENSACTARG